QGDLHRLEPPLLVDGADQVVVGPLPGEQQAGVHDVQAEEGQYPQPADAVQEPGPLPLTAAVDAHDTPLSGAPGAPSNSPASPGPPGSPGSRAGGPELPVAAQGLGVELAAELDQALLEQGEEAGAFLGA